MGAVSQRGGAGWKASLVVVLATGIVLFHVLACVESPMAFSPGGNLAFVVVDPYAGPDVPLRAGERTFRLLVLDKDRELRELERTSSHLLTGPA